jgi:hypothetical protein
MTKTAATRSKQWAQSEENDRIRRWRSSVVGMDHRTCMIFDLRDGCGVCGFEARRGRRYRVEVDDCRPVPKGV